MYFVYSIIFSVAFALLTPLFLLRREKYASGFEQRLGNYSDFDPDEREVIWLHCVSVGETNAARPLVEKLNDAFPDHRLVISTTTRTGQELAKKIFTGKADVIVHFPFDWKFSVRRALNRFRPSLVLLMETEIWPRFIHEAKTSGAKVAIVNGRLSQRSFDRYSRARSFVRRVLMDVDLAVMQTEADADRIIGLGLDPGKVSVTGNLKFEQTSAVSDTGLTEAFRNRFGISDDEILILAASTHEPEESLVIDALDGRLGSSCRLMIAPRHPERFEHVAKMIDARSFPFVRRSSPATGADKTAHIILLDTIGELRSAYPLADIVFVGGSLIPHGGQSVIEPAACGKAIVTGPFTANFDSVVKQFLESAAIHQIKESDATGMAERLQKEFTHLLEDKGRRDELGRNAAAVVAGTSRDASARTLECIRGLIHRPPTTNHRQPN